MAVIKFIGDWKKIVKEPGKYTASNFIGPTAGSLGLRVSPKGLKTWFLDYRLPDNRRQTLTLGRYPAVTFKHASDEAKAILEKIRQGSDPKAQQRESLEAPTMDTLFREYYERHAKPKKASAHQDADYYNRLIKPALGARKAKDIRRKDILSLLDNIQEQSGEVTRNRVLSLLMTMFNVGIDYELTQHNPCFRIKKIKEKSRDRVFTDEEIKTLWKEWEKERMGKLFMFKLLTAQRDKEVRLMRWDQITDGVWTIPAGVAKNGTANEVPLSKQAVALLATIPHRGEYVFYSARTGKHIVSSVKCFAKVATRSGITDARGHDLRRTAASKMAAMRISKDIIGRVLNHREHGVTDIYNRYNYLEEKRCALQKWADRLDIIFGRGKACKVVEIRKTA